MKTKLLSVLTGLIAVSILLASCSTSKKVVSSFGKRRYMKGYYFDFPSQNKVSSTRSTIAISKTSITVKNSDIVNEVLTENKNALNNSNIINKSSVNNNTATKNIISKNEVRRIESASTTKIEGMSSHSDDGGGHHGLNWAAILGFILAFFIPLLGLIFSIIGLSSELHGLAVAGVIISAILLILLIIAVAAVIAASAA